MLNLQRHLLKANWVWSLPKIPTDSAAMKVVGAVVNDWQLSGLYSRTSGNRYDLGFSYNTAGSAVNLTGSPDYGMPGGIIYDRRDIRGETAARAISTSSSTRPTSPGRRMAASGLESGRNVLIGCPIFRTDLAVARNIRFGKGARQVQLRVDAFNLVQPGGDRRPERLDQLQQPDRPDHPELAVPSGRVSRSDQGAAQECRIRRRE